MVSSSYDERWLSLESKRQLIRENLLELELRIRQRGFESGRIGLGQKSYLLRLRNELTINGTDPYKAIELEVPPAPSLSTLISARKAHASVIDKLSNEWLSRTFARSPEHKRVSFAHPCPNGLVAQPSRSTVPKANTAEGYNLKAAWQIQVIESLDAQRSQSIVNDAGPSANCSTRGFHTGKQRFVDLEFTLRLSGREGKQH
jgi:hypothetical protein